MIIYWLILFIFLFIIFDTFMFEIIDLKNWVKRKITQKDTEVNNG